MDLHRTNPNESLTTPVHLFIVLTLALGIRVYLWKSFPHVIFLHEADGIGYISIARSFIENFSFSATHFPPFYPSLIAVFSLITGDYESGARWASIMMGAGMTMPLYLACRYLMSSRAAFCAGLMAACFEPFVDYSLQPISQMTYIMLIALGVWCGLYCLKTPSRIPLAAFGLISAAIYLTRPEGILFFAFNFPLLVYATIKDRTALKRRLFNIAALAAGFLIPFSCYIIRLKQLLGNWTISGKSGVTSIGVDASMKLLPGGQTYGEAMTGTAGIANLFSSFSQLMATCLSQAGKFSKVAYSSLPVVVFVAGALGLALLIYNTYRQWQRGEKKTLWLLVMLLSPLTMLAPVMAFDKIALATGYILPFYMVIFCCCAYAIVWLEGCLAGRFEKLLTLPAVLKDNISIAIIMSVLLCWYLCFPVYQKLSSEDFAFMSGQQDFLLRKTGRWLRDNTDNNAKIMARWSNIGYYGDRGWTGLADGSIAEVTEYARKNAVTHIVIDSDAVPRRRPQLESLLNPGIPQPGLTPVYASEQFFTRVVIYQVK